MHIGSKPKLSRVAVGMLALLVAVQVFPPFFGFPSPFGLATGLQAQNDPTACEAVGNNWTNCQDAFSSNNVYAEANSIPLVSSPVPTKIVRIGAPADDGEITQGTFVDRLDLTGADGACTNRRLRNPGEFWRGYDLKSTITYIGGTWTFTSDWQNGNGASSFNIKIIVTDATGVEQRIIYDFGTVSPNVANDYTLTAAGVPQQSLANTERLAVHVSWVSGDDRVRVGNFDGTCDTRFDTPDEVVTPLIPGLNDTAWKDFGFMLSNSDVITSVEVGVEWFRTTAVPILNVTVSWDGGLSWATNQTATNKSADDDALDFLDFTSATAWDNTKLNDANFRARIGTNDSDARLDYVTVRVNYNVAPVISNFRIQETGTVQSQRDPTACEAVGDNWTTCQNAFSSGGAYAYANDSVATSGLSVKVDSFTRQTGTGNQAVTGVGFTPKVVVFWGTIKTAEGFSADLSHFQGFMVSATDQRALANFGTGGGGAARMAQKAIVIISDTSPTVSAEADFVSFDADGFTLDWTTNDGTQNIIQYMALGGVDLANVKVGHFVANQANGNQGVTGVGFQPKMVFMMGHGRMTAMPSNQNRGNFFGGYAVSSTERATLSWAHRDNTGRQATNQRTDRVIVVADQTGGNQEEADFVSMDADGFTINWLATNRALIIPYLAMAGADLNVKVGSFNSATTTGNQAVTGTGFQPDLVRLMTWSEPASTAILTNTKAAYGAATSPTAQGVAGVLREDATPANADDYTLTTKVIRLADPGAPPTTLAEADFVSFDADGFTLDWTMADATAREILYWAIGGTGGIGPGMNDTAWKDFGFALGADGISTVEIGVEWFRNNTAPVLDVTVSWDGGSTWATSQTATNKSSDDDTVEFLDFTSATAWTASKLNDANLRVRVSTNASGARLDYTTVRVSSTPSRAGTQLDVDTYYDYLFNVTDADGWSDIATDGNVSLNLWYDGNGTSTINQRDPTACEATGNNWTNCQDAFSSNDIYSYANETGSSGGITFQRAGGSGQSSTTTIDIGTAGNDRLVVVYGSVETTGQGQLSDVTVDGKSANFIALAQNNAGAGSHTQMWAIDEAALGSSSGTVTAELVGATGSWGIHVQVFYGVDSSTAFDSAIDDTSANPDNEIKPAVLNIPANGLLVFLAGDGSTGTFTDADWDTSPTEASDDGLSPEIEMTEVTDGFESGSPGGPFSAVMGTAYWISTESQQNNRQLRAQASVDPFNRGSGVIASFSAAGGGAGGPGNNDTAWRDFGFALSGSITQVEVGVEWFRNNTAPILNVSISWDGGSTWATNQTAINKSADDDAVEFLDFTPATSWTAAKLNDANLRVRVGTNASGARLDYVTVRVASDSGELAFSAQTTGANYRIVLMYQDTGDPSTASLSEWSVTEGRATYNASASGLTAILSGPTIIGYEFRLALKFGFQVKHAVAPTNSTTGAYNDLDSWNGEVVATDGPHTTTLQEASTGENMEFGVFMYTFVNISADWAVAVFHGQTANTNTVTVYRRSNDDFTLRIWFVTDLIKGGDTISITNVQILAAGDPTDDITADTAFAGLGEGNAVYILGSATLWFSHSTGTDEDTTTVQFSVTVAFGTPLGTYTAQLTIRIQQQP